MIYPNCLYRALVMAKKKAEGMFSVLAVRFSVEHTLAKTLFGILARVIEKVTTYTICFILNVMLS